MDAALVPHAALFNRAVIDFLCGGCTQRLIRLLAQEEPRTVLTRLTLPLRSPVSLQLLEQTLTQGQDALLAALTMAYAQLHAGSVNVAGLQLPCFRESKSTSIHRHQERSVAPLLRDA